MEGHVASEHTEEKSHGDTQSPAGKAPMKALRRGTRARGMDPLVEGHGHEMGSREDHLYQPDIEFILNVYFYCP